jgi:hypothetical protein
MRGMHARGMLALAVAGAAACGASAGRRSADEDAEARRLYPDLPALYAGDQGIYRGCAPNGGVCHNSHEFPDLHTVGSIVDNIDRGCNARRDRPETLHDLCERPGDTLLVGDDAIEIAWLEPTTAADPLSPREWLFQLREPASGAPDSLAIMRGEEWLYDLTSATAILDEENPSRVVVTLPATPDGPPPVEEEDLDVGTFLASALAGAGRTTDPMSVQLGDPNRNGTFGGELDGRIIRPGNPARSYLLHRLVDPAAGPLMPRANCCFWTRPALRALECWIEGLAPDGANALAPIDYDRCGPGSSVELLYPEPGPACEASGLCPVEAIEAGGDGFPALYSDILVPRCSGSGCHNQTPVGRIDFATEEAAWQSLSGAVVPGDPAASRLWQRLSPDLCEEPCVTMPLGRAPLPDDERERVRAWIEQGAPRE